MGKKQIVKRRPARRRGAPLTSERVMGIVSIINAWQGPLTWDDVCKRVASETGEEYTRQALNNYLPIKSAYTAHRKAPSPAAGEKAQSGTERKISDLERKVAELELLRDSLLEKFARWAVNASSRNLDESFLDQPLRPINRSENR